ncbi:hypothetical protein STRTUCAR8_00806 [Streptomyces turgidiscabies Car8]|uniref:Uncharacterized protein n=1 Tax=Streptomyces turgidiscabies (strain Car8) TaxID=698760 RepID=L7FDM9_STRT8|nr:hypothetical protein STRTUCAR8_00806 [Streptomyces turgidiscabies Car8]
MNCSLCCPLCARHHALRQRLGLARTQRLALLLLKERLNGRQAAGSAGAVLAVGLIALY